MAKGSTANVISRGLDQAQAKQAKQGQSPKQGALPVQSASDSSAPVPAAAIVGASQGQVRTPRRPTSSNTVYSV